MPILIKIATFLSPVLLNFLMKRGDEYIEKVLAKVGMAFNKEIDTTLVFVDEDGNPVHPQFIYFTAGKYGLVSKEPARDGSVILTGFEEGEKIDVLITVKDKSYTREIEINQQEVKRLVL